MIVIASVLLASCGSRYGLAPVSDLRWQVLAKFRKTHTVKAGETLYAIAFHYDTDYRQLAQLNHLRPPYTLKVGQVLTVQGITQKGRSLPPKRVTPGRYFRPLRPVAPKVIYSSSIRTRSSSGWSWPANGQVRSTFVPSQGKKGINIASKRGEKVYAASSGIVAYAGNGLAGYGNLIIIKHNYHYLTAYGNNARNLVREGQMVKQGQVIAEIGVIDHKYWGLHFEIRKAGQPVNPLNYLQKG